MTIRTLKAKYEAKGDSTSRIRRVFCASNDQKDIHYQFVDELDTNSEPDAAAETAIPTPPLVAAAPAVVARPVAPTTTAVPTVLTSPYKSELMEKIYHCNAKKDHLCDQRHP
jgi:hypothetical protein